MKERIRIKELFSRFVLIIMGSFIALFLIEVGLRLIPTRLCDDLGIPFYKHTEIRTNIESESNGNLSKWHIFDEILGYRGTPHIKGTNSVKRIYQNAKKFEVLNYSFNHNGEGLRDAVRDNQKSDEVLRIGVFGDSYMYGYGVEQDEMFSVFLEEMLGEAEVKAEVLNFGLCGYGTTQELLAFEKYGVIYKPDIVIVGFYVNDFLDNMLIGSNPRPFYRLLENGALQLSNVQVPNKMSKAADEFIVKGDNHWLLRFLSHSATYRILRDKIKFLITRIPSQYKRRVHFKDVELDVEETLATTKAILLRFQRQVELSGAKFLLVLIPTRYIHNLRSPRSEYLMSIPWKLYYGGNDIIYADKRIRNVNIVYQQNFLEWCKNEINYMLDLTDVEREYINETGNDLLHILYDGHWSPYGHRVAAGGVLSFIMQKKLLRR